MNIDDVIALEKSLLQSCIRHSSDQLQQLLAPNFRHIGASGRLWNRQDMIDELMRSDDDPIAATNFEGLQIDESTVLLTYDTARARRSSLWKLRENRWQLVFHQGTPYGAL